MGLNTPAIILNDLVHQLRADKDAGERIYRAVCDPYRSGFDYQPVKILPPSHSSGASIVAVGGNTIRRLAVSNDCRDDDEALLRKLADHLGYALTPIRRHARA